MPSKKNEDTKTRGTTESIGTPNHTKPDLLSLYEGMLKSRMFEKAVTSLWNEGKILGEMHLSMGEEAIVAGIVGHLTEGDSMALDHRGTAALVMRGVDLTLLLKEFLGRPDGLCRGWGGHMHLFSKAHMAASSGIVGAAGPAASGFGLAAKHLRPGKVAIAFFGEGAMPKTEKSLSVNGKSYALDISPDIPLLWVLREHLRLTGTKFGCGMAQCGACTIHLEGKAVRSCSIPVGEVFGKKITTIEGIPPDHPVKRAWIQAQVPQCGYCQPGQIMQAIAILNENRNPSREEVTQAMAGNLCRCGTYPRILEAIMTASSALSRV